VTIWYQNYFLEAMAVPILKLICTAALQVIAAGETDEFCPKVRSQGDALIQRATTLKAAQVKDSRLPNVTHVQEPRPRLSSVVGSRPDVVQQALRFWSWFDVFGEAAQTTSATTKAAHRSHSRWTATDKAVLAGLSLVVVLLDAFAIQRLSLKGLRAHLCVVAFWICVGLGYNAFVFVRHGPVAGLEWFNGYILEWLLSLDNLFVFHLIFQLYKTPSQVVHKALFLGIIGAVICRLGFFAIVRELLDFVSWLRIIFGMFLIWSGVQAAKEEEEGEAVNTTPVKALRWLLGNRLLDHYGKDAGNLIVWRDGNMAFTLLLPVVCCLEITDVVFALDSVSAKAAQIPDYWISVSSSILAMFALRAMFFVVQDFVAMFELMKYGLCCILVFIGIELICSDYFVLPPQVVCAVILSVFIVSIFGSAALVNNGGTDQQKADPHSEPVGPVGGLKSAE